MKRIFLPFRVVFVAIAGSSPPTRLLAWSPSANVVLPTRNRNYERTRVRNGLFHRRYRNNREVPVLRLWSFTTDNDDGASSSKLDNRSRNIEFHEPSNDDDRLREVSRRACVAAAAALVFVPKRSASADVTNKIASPTALRALERTRARLPVKLLPEARANNFVGIKARLRESPFDELRKNALVLVRGGEDGPKAAELLSAYKRLIAALEAVDATASLGMKGRKIDPFQLGLQYEDVAEALNVFLEVGAAAYAIPLQDAPST